MTKSWHDEFNMSLKNPIELFQRGYLSKYEMLAIKGCSQLYPILISSYYESLIDWKDRMIL